MPNWCSNRMHFSGEPAQIAEIKRLASGAVTPFYRRAAALSVLFTYILLPFSVGLKIQKRYTDIPLSVYPLLIYIFSVKRSLKSRLKNRPL